MSITGTGFTGTSAVHFGLLSAPFVIIDANHITATAPAQSAGVYDVTVTTPSGTSVNTINDNYTYTDGPTVTDVSPDTGPSSGVPATFVTITGTNFIVGGSGMTVKFGSTATTNFTVTTTTTINVIAPAHSAGTVDVVVTTPGGSSPISAADQFTFEGATVPVVTSVSPSSGPTGTVVVITGSGFTGVSCPGGITFGGVAAANDGSCVVNNDSTITAKVPANAPGGTIDVRVSRSRRPERQHRVRQLQQHQFTVDLHLHAQLPLHAHRLGRARQHAGDGGPPGHCQHPGRSRRHAE